MRAVSNNPLCLLLVVVVVAVVVRTESLRLEVVQGTIGCHAMPLLWLISRSDVIRDRDKAAKAVLRQALLQCPVVTEAPSEALPKNHVVGLLQVDPGLGHIDLFTQLTPDMKVQMTCLQDPPDAFTLNVTKVAKLMQPLHPVAQDRRCRERPVTEHIVPSFSKLGTHLIYEAFVPALANCMCCYENALVIARDILELWECDVDAIPLVGVCMLESICRPISTGRIHSIVMRRVWRASRGMFVGWPSAVPPPSAGPPIEEALASDESLSSRFCDVANLVRELVSRGPAPSDDLRGRAASAITLLDTVADQLNPGGRHHSMNTFGGLECARASRLIRAVLQADLLKNQSRLLEVLRSSIVLTVPSVF